FAAQTVRSFRDPSYVRTKSLWDRAGPDAKIFRLRCQKLRQASYQFEVDGIAHRATSSVDGCEISTRICHTRRRVLTRHDFEMSFMNYDLPAVRHAHLMKALAIGPSGPLVGTQPSFYNEVYLLACYCLLKRHPTRKGALLMSFHCMP